MMTELIKTVSTKVTDKDFRSKSTYSRPVFIFWGPAGVGKTHSAKQAGNEANLPVINIRLGQEMAEDMSYPEVADGKLRKIIAEMWPRYSKNAEGNHIPRQAIVNGKKVNVDGEYQIDFASIKTYIENYSTIESFYTEQGLTVNDAPGGILFLDEINRIEDKGLFQMIFQLFESGKFKGFELPAEVSLFGACNPDSEDYITSPWFEDKAFANRCIHLSVTFDRETSKDIFKKGGYSDVTTEFLAMNPELMFKQESNQFDIPKVDYSLRNASFFETYVVGIDWKESKHPEIVNELIGTVYGWEFIKSYEQILEKTAKKAFEAEEILAQYDEYKPGKATKDEKGRVVYANVMDAAKTQKPTSKIRKEMISLVEDDRIDFVQRVKENMVAYIVENFDNDGFQEEFAANSLRFLRFSMDLPRAVYAEMLKELLDKSTFEGRSTDFIRFLMMPKVTDKKSKEKVDACRDLILKLHNEITNG